MNPKLSGFGLAAAISALFWALTLALALLASAAKADEPACQSLKTSGLFANTTVSSAQMVAADAAQGMRAYCEVKATISPTAKSKIAVVYRLPEGWNGKMLGLGGGGWAGNVTLASAVPGLKKGYATAQTNGGHDNVAVFDTGWAKDNPEAVLDFSHRAIHLMTVVGKAVVGRYYGRPQQAAYFQGCSTGGRMGLMEAQRYPADYNAVIAGAPVYNLVVQTSSLMKNRLFSTPETALSKETVARLNQAALDACDAADGLKDGIVTDPRACRFDPAAIQCRDAASADCLTPAQAAAVRKAYTTTRTASGRMAVPALSRGGEAGWPTFVAMQPAKPTAESSVDGLRAFIYGSKDYDTARFDPVAETDKVRSSPFAKEYEASDPDIRAFLKAGGKLLLWHGFDDPGPSPLSTIEYYDQVKATTGANSAVRLFVAPGLYHCGGGPGANQIDGLSALEQWEATGAAPATIAAARTDSAMQRPVCAWPGLPYYRGEGDPNAIASFACRSSAPLTQASAR
jgi:feruloyl esterase